MPDAITPGERRELRTVVKGQYKVLRAEVKRRESEMIAEIEAELLERYRAEDQAVAQAWEQIKEIEREAIRQAEAVGRELAMAWPDLEVKAGMGYRGLELRAENSHRHQLRRAALSAVPTKVADAQLELDRQEVGLLRDLSEGALGSVDAKGFLGTIPTVGELVPRARLRELEKGMTRDP